jgi:hypothetical protein
MTVRFRLGHFSSSEIHRSPPRPPVLLNLHTGNVVVYGPWPRSGTLLRIQTEPNLQ